jgi:hypothetical protein
MAWKKTMQVPHTAGEPPRSGRTILAIIGWTQNRRSALRKSVRAKSKSRIRFRIASQKIENIIAVLHNHNHVVEGGPGSTIPPK